MAPHGIGPRQALLAAGLTLLGAGAWWWSETGGPEQQPSRPTERRPDYIVDDIEAIQMDAAGQVRREFSAVVLRHYPDDGSSVLEHPSLTLYHGEAPPWLVKARTGWISADGELVQLRGEVVIERASDANLRPLRIQTEALTVKPREEYVETDLPARLTSTVDWIESTGLRAWLAGPLRLELHGRVQATFDIADEIKRDD